MARLLYITYLGKPTVVVPQPRALGQVSYAGGVKQGGISAAVNADTGRRGRLLPERLKAEIKNTRQDVY